MSAAEKVVPTVMFVEDDPVVVKVYHGALVNAGYNVVLAEDGLTAMKSLLTVKPALVLLDLLMPKVDGTYVLKYIRSQPEMTATKVILLSVASHADAARKAIEQGPDRVLLKSQCTPKQLVSVVDELLQKNF